MVLAPRSRFECCKTGKYQHLIRLCCKIFVHKFHQPVFERSRLDEQIYQSLATLSAIQVLCDCGCRGNVFMHSSFRPGGMISLRYLHLTSKHPWLWSTDFASVFGFHSQCGDAIWVTHAIPLSDSTPMRIVVLWCYMSPVQRKVSSLI